MKITWLGHSSFMLEDGRVTVITDPYDDTVGYAQPEQAADVVVSSHDHFDHNYIQGVKGDPVVLNKPGRHEAAGVAVHGIATYHDGEGGEARGLNVVNVLEMGGFRVAHLGDLGHVLTDEQAAALGAIDVLLIPVGGTFTIDYRQAAAVVAQLAPSTIVPMHFKNDACTWDLDTEQPFVERMKAKYPLEYSDKSWFEPVKGQKKLLVLKHRF